jgi:hypothetical protein
VQNLVIRQRQELTQVAALHENVTGQGSQVDMQSSRRATQSQGGGGQAFGHKVVTPSQVTDPCWPTEQFWSAPEQLVVLLLPLQLIVPPDPQFAETLQRAFPPRAGRFAAGVGAGVPREARKTLSAGAPCDPPAAAAGGTRKANTAKLIEIPRTIFFMTISFLE